MQKDHLVKELSKINSKSTFMTIKDYQNDKGEVSDYSIVFHTDYRSALQKSINILESYNPINDNESKAKESLLANFKSSLKKLSNSSEEEIDERYLYIKDENDNYIKGIKVNKNSGNLYVYGMVVHKKSTSSDKTVKTSSSNIAKQKLLNMCPVSKMRQFVIDKDKLSSITVENKTIDIS